MLMFMFMFMFMFVLMRVLVRVRVLVCVRGVRVIVRMRVGMGMRMLVCMKCSVFVRQMYIKFNSLNSHFLPARNMKVISFHSEFAQFVLELIAIHPEVDERANKHIAADATE